MSTVFEVKKAYKHAIQSLCGGVFASPGSSAAATLVLGNQRWREFCDAEGVRWEPRNKLVVATSNDEGKALSTWFERHRAVARGASSARAVKGSALDSRAASSEQAEKILEN